MEIQFSTKIKKLKSDNEGEYVNKWMNPFLETNGIIHNLSLPYAYASNGVSVCINCTIVTMVGSMTQDYADVIPPAL
jgi:hypothetical protein